MCFLENSLISAGIVFGPWSPSSLNVIRVPSFHPLLTRIDNILSRTELVWPSSFITCRDIFIFLSQPRYNSSRLACNSRSMGASCVLPPNVPFLFSGIWISFLQTFDISEKVSEFGHNLNCVKVWTQTWNSYFLNQTSKVAKIRHMLKSVKLRNNFYSVKIWTWV